MQKPPSGCSDKARPQVSPILRTKTMKFRSTGDFAPLQASRQEVKRVQPKTRLPKGRAKKGTAKRSQAWSDASVPRIFQGRANA